MPKTPIGVTTIAQVEPDPKRRVALVRMWTEKPDFASVNWSEDGAAALATALVEMEIGIEAGIWTIDRRLSRPPSDAPCMGTPSTGNTVFDAVIPGKCAAPPAPAIITSIPRFSALPAYSKSKSGVLCAETTRVSCGTQSSSNMCAACCIVSQSEVDPMMIPTSALPFFSLDVIAITLPSRPDSLA